MITGTTWQWEETQTPVEKITSPAPDRYTLLLLPDGRANSRFDCNRGGGSYRIVEPGRISFGTMATTMMACPPGSLDRRFARISVRQAAISSRAASSISNSRRTAARCASGPAIGANEAVRTIRSGTTNIMA